MIKFDTVIPFQQYKQVINNSNSNNMKIHHYQKHNQKPIKYKEFIQELHNSSRSSNQDHSLLSQRSFRESNTVRDKTHLHSKHKDDINKSIQNDERLPPKLSMDFSYTSLQQAARSRKLSKSKSQRQSNNNTNKTFNNNNLNDNKNNKQVQNGQKKDKLYTFCDAKYTQKSIQMIQQQSRTIKKNNDLNQYLPKNDDKMFSNHKNKQHTNEQIKYFRTMKHKNEQKENINFVNKMLDKVDQMVGFQGKILKTESAEVQYHLSQQNARQPCKNNSSTGSSHQNNEAQSQQTASQPSTHRKIESIKKVSIPAGHPVKQMSTQKEKKKLGVSSQMQQKRSRQSSLIKKHSCQPQSEKKQNDKLPSSKKKVISLNINSLKTNNNGNMNKIKLKLSLDKSYEQMKVEKQQSINTLLLQKEKATGLVQHPSNALLIETKNMMCSSLEKMPSLQQSKIESLYNEGSKSNLLMSGVELADLTGLLIRQKDNQMDCNFLQLQKLSKTVQQHKQKQKKLSKTVQQQKQKQKKLSKQLNQLKQRMKYHTKQGDDKKQLQILQKDCSRLTNSYKQIKKLYEMAVDQKYEIYQQLETLKKQNMDLKQCLLYKTHLNEKLEKKLVEVTNNVNELERQKQQFPSKFMDLSEIIKQKMQQYDFEIANLVDQNNKLTLLREKLQNYNATLKEDIHEKDDIIDRLQQQQKEYAHLRRSCKDEIEEKNRYEAHYTQKIKELQSKLKLANTHIEYLTKQIVELKEQKQKNFNTARTSNSSMAMEGGLMSHLGMLKTTQSTNFNTITNTITTRNSSICHGRYDPLLPNTLKHEKYNDNFVEYDDIMSN